jgi:hypothetical protein
VQGDIASADGRNEIELVRAVLYMQVPGAEIDLIRIFLSEHRVEPDDGIRHCKYIGVDNLCFSNRKVL